MGAQLNRRALCGNLAITRKLDVMHGLPEDVVELRRRALVELLDSISRLWKVHGGAMAAESPAASDVASARNAGSARTVQAQAAMLLEVAGDHVSAAARMLMPPHETVAEWTCVRAALEASAFAVWLLEPGVSIHARVQRSIALRYEGVDQQLKYARSAGADNESVTRVENRLDQIVRQAESYGPITGSKKRRPPGLPKATDVVGRMLGDESSYRLMSAVVHGHFWAIHQLSFREDAAATIVAQEHGFAAGIEKSLNPIAVSYLALTAARGFAAAVWHQWRYMGWDLAALKATFESTFDRLVAKDEHRFWRSDLAV